MLVRSPQRRTAALSFFHTWLTESVAGPLLFQWCWHCCAPLKSKHCLISAWRVYVHFRNVITEATWLTHFSPIIGIWQWRKTQTFALFSKRLVLALSVLMWELTDLQNRPPQLLPFIFIPFFYLHIKVKSDRQVNMHAGVRRSMTLIHQSWHRRPLVKIAGVNLKRLVSRKPKHLGFWVGSTPGWHTSVRHHLDV